MKILKIIFFVLIIMGMITSCIPHYCSINPTDCYGLGGYQKNQDIKEKILQ